jgi:ribose/xylose/arabinose/galactoside ABC-type transport system permease subunit
MGGTPNSGPAGTKPIFPNQATLKLRPLAMPTPPRRFRRPKIPLRFVAIWAALAIMLALGDIFLPRSTDLSTILSVLPFAGFLAIAAMGQSIVVMARGIDLSVPSVVALSSAVLLGVSGGSDDRLWPAIGAAILVAVVIGAVNGALIAVLKMNALIVTLAVGAVVTGLAIWYRQSVAAESNVPPSLADFGSARAFGIPTPVLAAVILILVIDGLLRKTILGRRFEAMGANPRAAYATGVAIIRYQAGAYVVAGALYGVMAVLLSGFIRNPTLEVGTPYLLAPIAASVLGGTAISGGIGSMIAVAGASIFLVQLDQSLKMLGVPTSWQLIIQGLAIAVGMWLAEMTASGRHRR